MLKNEESNGFKFSFDMLIDLKSAFEQNFEVCLGEVGEINRAIGVGETKTILYNFFFGII